MKTLAGALQNVGSQAERVRIIYDLFGRSGLRMVNLFNDGAEGLQAMYDEADKLGITVSQLDTAKAAMMVDMMDKLKRVFNAVIRHVAIGFIPVMMAVGEMFLEWVKGAGDWGSTMTTWIDRIVDGFAEIARVGNFIAGIWNGMQAVIMEIVGWVSKLAAKVAGLFDEDLANLLNTVAEEEFAGADKLWQKGAKNWEKAFNPVNESAEGIRDTISDIQRRAQEIADNAMNAASTLGETVDTGEETGGGKRGAIAAVEKGSAAAMDVISKILMGDQEKTQREQLAVLNRIDGRLELGNRQAADNEVALGF
jgi:methyl-accepting chemotaxis protein